MVPLHETIMEDYFDSSDKHTNYMGDDGLILERLTLWVVKILKIASALQIRGKQAHASTITLWIMIWKNK